MDIFLYDLGFGGNGMERKWVTIEGNGECPNFLFSFYSHPAFYTRYIVDATLLLIAAGKRIFGQ